MPKTRPPYPPQVRARLIELARSGRTPEDLGRQFEPSAQTIRNWLRQADRDDGRRADGLTTEEREEIRRLRREVKALREDREILRKATAWFARETGSLRPGIRVREGVPGRAPRGHRVPSAGGLPQRVLRVAVSSALGAGPGRLGAQHADPGDPRPLPRDLWGAAGPRRVGRAGGPRGPPAGRAPHAPGPVGRGEPPPACLDHPARSRQPPCSGPGAARLHGGGAESALGRRPPLQRDTSSPRWL